MENTNFNLKIKRLPYSRLLKSEIADSVEKTINIVGRHDLKSVLIDPLFQQLSVKKPDIQLLRLNYGIDTERPVAKNISVSIASQHTDCISARTETYLQTYEE